MTARVDRALARRVAKQIRDTGVDPGVAVRALLNEIATARGFVAPWEAPVLELSVVDSIEVVGEIHQLLLGRQDGQRGKQGAYYTPDPIADFLTRFVDDITQNRLPDVHPWDIVLIDPACGAGVLLVHAARTLVDRLVAIEGELGRALIRDVYGAEVTDAELARGWFAKLAADCVFGVDIDPIAVETTKTALWLETDGTVPITWLDRNVIVGNVLDGDQPPALVDRYGGNPPPLGPEPVHLALPNPERRPTPRTP